MVKNLDPKVVAACKDLGERAFIKPKDQEKDQEVVTNICQSFGKTSKKNRLSFMADIEEIIAAPSPSMAKNYNPINPQARR